MSIVKKTCNIGKVAWDIWCYRFCRIHVVYEAYAIAQLLGHKHPDVAIKNYVDPWCCMTWKIIKTHYDFSNCNCGPNCIFQQVLPQQTRQLLPQKHCPPTRWKPNTLFINKEGVISLINNCKTPTAKEFEKWFCKQKEEADSRYEEIFSRTSRISVFQGSDPNESQPRSNEEELPQQTENYNALTRQQHQQQRRQQRQQRPMVVQKYHKRPTHRNGTRGSTTPRTCK